MTCLQRLRQKTRLWAALFIICVTLNGCSKKPQQTPTSPQSSGSTLSYPITSQFPLPAPVTINDRPYRFFLDTGCTLSILNLPHRDLLGPQTDTITSNGPLMQASNVNMYAIPDNLKIRLGLTTIKGEMMCRDFADFGCPFDEFDGIIGMDVLQHAVLQIDWTANRITLYINRNDLDSGDWGNEFTILTPRDNADPYLQLQLTETISETFLVDTASGQTFIAQDTFAQLMKELRPDKEYTPQPITEMATSRQGITIKNATLQGTAVNELVFAENPRSILGMNFFRQYTLITFDFPNRKLYLK